MSAGRQQRFSEYSSRPTLEELEELYEEYDGNISRIARYIETLGRSRIQDILEEHGIHEPSEYHPHRFIKMLPQDVGLPVLRCAECRAECPDGHPCPECGFDPRNQGGSRNV